MNKFRSKGRIFLDRMEARRWQFFADHPAGQKILAWADKLHAKHPESKLVNRIWLNCLPF